MRIGIITFHRANNYGAVLQCYALQSVLESLNYEVKVIDYRQPDTEEAYQPISLTRIRKMVHTPVQFIKDILLIPLRLRNAYGFNTFRNNYLNCTVPVCQPQNMPQDFDVYLLGSDQLWSILCTGGHIEDVFWGNFKHPTKSIINGYAISATISSLETIGSKRIKQNLCNFTNISLREESVATWLQKQAKCECRVDIDPTLLLDNIYWERLIKETKKLSTTPYLLSYYLMPNQKAIAKQYAKAYGLKYVEMGYVASSPIHFLALVKNATLIVGGSFHIAVFSIIFKKPFYVIRKGSGFDIRSEYLLNKLHLENQMIDISSLPSKSPYLSIYYDDIDSKLQELKKNSIEYLASFNLSEAAKF